MSELERALVWRRLDGPGAEYFALTSTEAGWQLEGAVVRADANRPLRVQYRIECDASWHTRRVHVEMQTGTTRRHLELAAGDERRWWQGDRERVELRGCLDIDLGVTPSTNTLPIRRLQLPIGAYADVTAAWIRFPELTVEPLSQRYTRLEERRYRYASRGGSFVAELAVDEMGLVVRYGDWWVREAEIGG